MSRTIILMIHGGCDRDHTVVTERGTRESLSVGQQMIDAGICPDIIVHANIPPAAQTANMIAELYKAAGKQVNEVRKIERPRPSPLTPWETSDLPPIARMLNDQHHTVLAIVQKGVITDLEKLTGNEIDDWNIKYSDAFAVSIGEASWKEGLRPTMRQILWVNRIVQKFETLV